MAHSSKTAFAQAMVDFGLLDPQVRSKFSEFGWDTYNDFAFATSDPAGRDATAFQKEVLDVVLPDDGSKKHLIPKLRRLYAQAYVFATKAMTDEAEPKSIQEVVPMHPADRTTRTQKLRDRITGWSLSGMNLPSQALIDKFATMLSKGNVKYIAWEKCTSKEQEMLDEPDVKGLRITQDGLLLQDVAKDMKTDLAGEFLWDFALRRRACAGDVSGLITYEAQNEWQELLKSFYLKSPPPGHRRVSWAQLRNADVELWTQVALACEDGTKGDNPDVTAFEKAWREKMNDQHVRACLQFLPGAPVSSTSSSSDRPGVTLTAGPGASSDSAEVAKLKRRLDQQDVQINNLKRQKGKGKGKDKGKKGKKQHRAPRDLGGRNAMTPNG